MDYTDLLEVVGAIGLSLGGGSVIVFALSKWVGNIWAGRILESEKSRLAREDELLVRRRDVYSNLAIAMRVFIESDAKASPDEKNKFLNAYDLAALWASEEVILQMAKFLDSIGDCKRFCVNG